MCEVEFFGRFLNQKVLRSILCVIFGPTANYQVVDLEMNGFYLVDFSNKLLRYVNKPRAGDGQLA